MTEGLKNQVQYEDILQKGGVFITHLMVGAEPATTANYDVIYTALRPVEILAVAETHRVASTSGTLNLEILDSGEALDAGDLVLVTAFSTASTANTPVIKRGKDFTNKRILKEGQRLALVDAGTLTNSAGLCVTVYFAFANKGNFF